MEPGRDRTSVNDHVLDIKLTGGVTGAEAPQFAQSASKGLSHEHLEVPERLIAIEEHASITAQSCQKPPSIGTGPVPLTGWKPEPPHDPPSPQRDGPVPAQPTRRPGRSWRAGNPDRKPRHLTDPHAPYEDG